MLDEFAVALELLAALPPLADGWQPFWSGEPELPEVAARFNRGCNHLHRWFIEGIRLPDPLRERVAQVWRNRPDLRRLLDPLIIFYPCREFKRPFLRNAENGGHGHFEEWFRLFPDLHAHLRSFVLARARRFNQGFVAIDAGLLWARYYDGGDTSWHLIACAIKRDDRLELKRPYGSGFLRHDLETHGRITRDEAGHINRFLANLGVEPLAHWR